MTGSARHCLLGSAATALAMLVASTVQAAPLAQELGPEASAAQAANGFVGKLVLAPDHGPVGSDVTVTANSLPANQDVDLVWRTVRGSWKAGNGEYRGRDYQPVGYRIAVLHSDAAGHASAHFTAPEDFGFAHDLVLQQGNRLLTQASFSIDMEMKLSPASGPVGTPIQVDIHGIGWRELESSYLLRYDNNYTGWISAITTHGEAHFTIPATGAPGVHVLEAMHGEFTFPYLNNQQTPEPDRPRFVFQFTVSPGDPVLPPKAEAQGLRQMRGLPTPGALAANPGFSPIAQKTEVRGAGFAPGKSYALNWTTVTGNRVAGSGWEKSSRIIAEAKADGSGNLAFRFAVPDDLGGAHGLWVQDGAAQKTGSYWVTPTALPLDVARGPAGSDFTIHLKGVGWTETANIYAVVYDNSYIGYACGFNSQGDVTIHMKASGEPGWHYIDLYPAIYKGKETHPDNFRIPQLTYAADHPGEDLPAFHYAFEVTPGEQRASAP